jgi:Tol biopolymer transport system component
MGMGQVRIEAVTTDPERETNLQASPDGGSVLFNLHSTSQTKQAGFLGRLFSRDKEPASRPEYQTTIALIEPGKPGKTLVSPEGARDPAWLPSGDGFLFSMEQGGQALLAISRLGEGGAAVRFVSPTPCGAFDFGPSVSSDGKSVAFVTVTASEPRMLALLDLEVTGAKCRLLFSGESPRWSPDGGALVFSRTVSGRSQLFVFRETTNQLTQITFGDAHSRSGSWSPDGERLVFTSDRNGSFDLFVIDADGANLVRITSGPTIDVDPTWSVDGRVYFVSNAGGQWDIWRADVL